MRYGRSMHQSEVQFCCSLVDRFIGPYHPPYNRRTTVHTWSVQHALITISLSTTVKCRFGTSCTKCWMNRSTMYALTFRLNCWFCVAVHAVCCHVWVHHLPVSCSINKVHLICGDGRQTTVYFAAMEQWCCLLEAWRPLFCSQQHLAPTFHFPCILCFWSGIATGECVLRIYSELNRQAGLPEHSIKLHALWNTASAWNSECEWASTLATRITHTR